MTCSGFFIFLLPWLFSFLATFTPVAFFPVVTAVDNHRVHGIPEQVLMLRDFEFFEDQWAGDSTFLNRFSLAKGAKHAKEYPA